MLIDYYLCQAQERDNRLIVDSVELYGTVIAS